MGEDFLQVTPLNTRKAHDYQIMGFSWFAEFIRQILLEVATSSNLLNTLIVSASFGQAT